MLNIIIIYIIIYIIYSITDLINISLEIQDIDELCSHIYNFNTIYG